ncbi:MAG: TraB/GumN family protein [Spirochaetaceae bacterium]|nr:TraB/GumN family protein [Spirochaetaceae bacterium]
MKKLAVLFFAGLIIAGPAPAQSSVWKISNNENFLYLGGSIHILRSGDYPLPGAFDAAFNESDILVLETDVRQMSNPEVLEKMMSQMSLPGDETLQTVLSKRTYRELELWCGKYELSMDMVMKLKPAMVINVLGSLQSQYLGFVQLGADLFYLSKAKDEAKALGFLEPIDLQIDLLTGMGSGYEDEYVRYSFEDWERMGKELDLLVAEWKRGSAGRIESTLIRMKAKFPAVYRAMFADRNNSWMPLIEGYLHTREVEFIITGLGHLYGPDGVLPLLRSRGYRVEQMP